VIREQTRTAVLYAEVDSVDGLQRRADLVVLVHAQGQAVTARLIVRRVEDLNCKARPRLGGTVPDQNKKRSPMQGYAPACDDAFARSREWL
jgi:hypothetical protein